MNDSGLDSEANSLVDMSCSELGASVVVVSNSEISESEDITNVKNTEVEKHLSQPSSGADGEVDIDNNLPETAILLKTFWGSKVYVVGTAHFSRESQEDVAKVIQAVQPNYVVLELCSSRAHLLQWEEEEILEQAKNINFQMMRDVIKNNGVVQGALYLMLLSLSAHITRELGMAPGGEFRRAFQEAAKVPRCLVLLGDRPIDITLRRAFASLSWWQSIKLSFHLIWDKDPIKKEDVERCKNRDYLEEIIAEIAGEYPELKKVFVNERDIHLAYSLQHAALAEPGVEGPRPCKVVGVVGIGHLPGIQANWDRLHDFDIESVLLLPPRSRSSKFIRFTFKATFICLTLYGIHSLASKVVYVPTLSDIRNFSVGSFLKLPFEKLNFSN